MSREDKTCIRVGGRTPWGAAQDVVVLAPGVYRAYTASHGGIWVDKDERKKIPKWGQDYARVWSGYGSWFEEDCAANLVMYYVLGDTRQCVVDSVKQIYKKHVLPKEPDRLMEEPAYSGELS